MHQIKFHRTFHFRLTQVKHPTMTVFAIEKPKKTYKPGFVLMILVVAVVISFSIGLLAGYLAIKENEKDGKNTRSYSVDELLEIFSAEHVKNTIR